MHMRLGLRTINFGGQHGEKSAYVHACVCVCVRVYIIPVCVWSTRRDTCGYVCVYMFTYVHAWKYVYVSARAHDSRVCGVNAPC
jgi:hypothetical protein